MMNLITLQDSVPKGDMPLPDVLSNHLASLSERSIGARDQPAPPWTWSFSCSLLGLLLADTFGWGLYPLSLGAGLA
jgi:hypothetical protein